MYGLMVLLLLGEILLGLWLGLEGIRDLDIWSMLIALFVLTVLGLWVFGGSRAGKRRR